MSLALRVSSVFGLLLVIGAGCGDGKNDASEERLAKMAGGKLQETFPVSGKVLVDGEPREGVMILLYKEGALPATSCTTDEKGEYCWSTNKACDGLEPGKYRLGFQYFAKQKKNDSGQDLFKGKYNNPLKSEFALEVREGSAQTGVNFELKLK